MRLYIRREDQVDFQSTWFFVYIGINSDGSAWFLICASLKSQHFLLSEHFGVRVETVSQALVKTLRTRWPAAVTFVFAFSA